MISLKKQKTADISEDASRFKLFEPKVTTFWL